MYIITKLFLKKKEKKLQRESDIDCVLLSFLSGWAIDEEKFIYSLSHSMTFFIRHSDTYVFAWVFLHCLLKNEVLINIQILGFIFIYNSQKKHYWFNSYYINNQMRILYIKCNKGTLLYLLQIINKHTIEIIQK